MDIIIFIAIVLVLLYYGFKFLEFEVLNNTNKKSEIIKRNIKNDKLVLTAEMNYFFEKERLKTKNEELKGNIFYYKLSGLDIEELKEYYKPYEKLGFVEESLSFEAKAEFFLTKLCGRLIEFLNQQGHKTVSNFTKPEKNEMWTRYRIIIDDWALCNFVEIRLPDAGIMLSLSIQELKK